MNLLIKQQYNSFDKLQRLPIDKEVFVRSLRRERGSILTRQFQGKICTSGLNVCIDCRDRMFI